jgi:hypothetical protein
MLWLMLRVLAGRFRRPDKGLGAEIEDLRRKYAGRAPADAKPALAATLKERGHTVPEPFLDLMAEAVTGVHE